MRRFNFVKVGFHYSVTSHLMSDARHQTCFHYKLSVFTVGRCFSADWPTITGIGSQVRSNQASGRASRRRGRLAPTAGTLCAGFPMRRRASVRRAGVFTATHSTAATPGHNRHPPLPATISLYTYATRKSAHADRMLLTKRSRRAHGQVIDKRSTMARTLARGYKHPRRSPESTDEAKSNDVKLRSNEGDVFTVPMEVACRSVKVKELVDDDDFDQPFSLRNVNTKTLEKVIQFCKFDTEAKDGKDITVTKTIT